MNLLEENGAMSPKNIAECLKKNMNTLYSILFRMKQEGQIIQEDERGLYKLPSKTIITP
jgi:DNA-binding IclR family transcriptional regulator